MYRKNCDDVEDCAVNSVGECSTTCNDVCNKNTVFWKVFVQSTTQLQTFLGHYRKESFDIFGVNQSLIIAIY